MFWDVLRNWQAVVAFIAALQTGIPTSFFVTYRGLKRKVTVEGA